MPKRQHAKLVIARWLAQFALPSFNIFDTLVSRSTALRFAMSARAARGDRRRTRAARAALSQNGYVHRWHTARWPDEPCSLKPNVARNGLRT